MTNLEKIERMFEEDRLKREKIEGICDEIIAVVEGFTVNHPGMPARIEIGGSYWERVQAYLAAKFPEAERRPEASEIVFMGIPVRWVGEDVIRVQ
jgi:hypothetical protein